MKISVPRRFVVCIEVWDLRNNLILENPYINYVDRKLCIGPTRRPIQDVIGKYSGPTYVYDTAIVDLQLKQYSDFMPNGFNMHYAMKANANPELLKFLKSRNVHLDVVSGGEIKIALACGFRPEQIIFSGVGKTKNEIEFAVQVGLKQINVESLPELERIVSIANQLQKNVNVAVRINPDISVQTHPYISTGLRENKFGLELEAIPFFAEIIKKQKLVKWRGISVHLGSQIFEINPLRDALRSLIQLTRSYQKEFGLDRIDLGGGIGVDYENFNFVKEQHFLKLYGEMVREETRDAKGEFMIEPGRSIVAHCGVLVCEVQYVKRTKEKVFVILDSGMNHLLRPALYSAQHQVYALEQKKEDLVLCDIVGPICESSDVLRTGISLPGPKSGDLMAICDVGAYGFSMSSQYNQHALANEITI